MIQVVFYRGTPVDPHGWHSVIDESGCRDEEVVYIVSVLCGTRQESKWNDDEICGWETDMLPISVEGSQVRRSKSLWQRHQPRQTAAHHRQWRLAIKIRWNTLTNVSPSCTRIMTSHLAQRKVLDATILCTVFYGCESWLNADLNPVTKWYYWRLEQMFGVRGTTSVSSSQAVRPSRLLLIVDKGIFLYDVCRTLVWVMTLWLR